ncbi:MAG TPA: amidohydrolase family protein, partial [Candidatus Thermoplasmatota archaeon]
SGMTLTPTVGINGGYRLLAAERPRMFDDPRVEAFFPWARPTTGGSAAGLDVQRRMVSDMAGTARRVVDAGGRVIAGTDSPINPMGLSLHAELEAYVRYGGMSPFEALRSATAWAGEALGYPGVLGVVREGALADLLVVDGDVLRDVTRAREVETVVRGGRVFQAAALLSPVER